jgi:hypothetical protein
MQSQRYSELTIRHYLSAVAHFNHWAVSRPLAVANIRETEIREFIALHLPICACPNPLDPSRHYPASEQYDLATILPH